MNMFAGKLGYTPVATPIEANHKIYKRRKRFHAREKKQVSKASSKIDISYPK